MKRHETIKILSNLLDFTKECADCDMPEDMVLDEQKEYKEAVDLLRTLRLEAQDKREFLIKFYTINNPVLGATKEEQRMFSEVTVDNYLNLNKQN